MVIIKRGEEIKQWDDQHVLKEKDMIVSYE